MTTISIYPTHRLNHVSGFLLGHFVELFDTNIVNGIFMPGHPLADEDGFRKDILEKLREVNVSQIRWAGNFSSNYHWLDGVGNPEKRPKKYDYAWQRIEDNRFGTAEFIKLCRKLGAEPVIGVNMGSGTPEEAMNWVEYCNGTGDSEYANLRRSHGYEEPFNVKYWCLGNEMYAQWQFGFQKAEEYAHSAIHFAYAMRRVDPSIKLTAVGLETDPEWNYKIVRELAMHQTAYAPQAGDYINFLSAHYYAIGNEGAFANSDYKTRLSLGEYYHERSVLMRNAIENATNDLDSPIKIAWDEWHPVAVPDGTEFTLEAALLSASIINWYIRDSSFVEMANYTFFVGGNGPIKVKNDKIILQPEFYMMKMFAENLGVNLIESIDDSPKVNVKMPVDQRWFKKGESEFKDRDISLIDVVTTIDSDENVSTFIINKGLEDADIEIKLNEIDAVYKTARIETLWNKDLRANNFVNPKNVIPQENKVDIDGNHLKLTLPAHSFNVITFNKKEL